MEPDRDDPGFEEIEVSHVPEPGEEGGQPDPDEDDDDGYAEGVDAA